ncbi:MAG: polyketide synthase, partial [Desulfobacterales bacterium]|nr:polyketide synthase [Desulfobacterales bacterium]
MIKRLLGSRLPLIVYNPPRVFDMNYFRKAWEAGALPVLDTEFFEPDAIIRHVESLAREKFAFGVRIFVHQTAVIDSLKENMIPNLDLIVFAYHGPGDLDAFDFDCADYTFFMETVHTELAQSMERIAPHGLIVKGCEAPGKTSRFTSFVLMQWWLENSSFPVFVHGGVGRRTGAGMFAAGCCGVALDNQLYLCDEAPLSDDYKGLMENIEDGDSVLVGDSLGVHYRFFAKIGTLVVKKLKERESRLTGEADAERLLYEEITAGIAAMDQGESAPVQRLLYLGQDAVFAKGFVRESRKIKEVVNGFFLHMGEMLREVDAHDPLVPDGKLARAHGTRLPVMQGPMANISDNGDFARAVLDAGGLPFFAMGSLPADLAETMLSEGSGKVNRFGAGLIGIETFNATIDEHMALVKKYKAPFALFAGGIPGQVKELEAAGVRAYLHTPSIRMLENAIKSGCTRFIFEGTEAGGHVGSLTSLVLWEMAMDVFLNLPDETLATMSIVFAGGIGSPSASHF